MQYGQHLNPNKTPQSSPIPGKTMQKNEAGGFGFAKDWYQRLMNFLILGSEGGTYYVGERELTVENGQHILELVKDKEKGLLTVAAIVEISRSGRAPKNDPAIFALALAAAHGEKLVKEAARAAIPSVCRTGTHLFSFMETYKQVGGKTSRQLKRGVASFYTLKDTGKVAMQLIKYRQRGGWTHRDVLRQCHAKGKPGTPLGSLLRWAVGKGEGEIHPLVDAFNRVQSEKDPKKVALMAMEYQLPWEALPTEMLNEKQVWDGLLTNMGYTALLRNLGKLTSLGFFSGGLGEDTKLVCKQLTDLEEIKKGRVHPFQILLAYSTYRQGRGVKGSLTWNRSEKILGALDDAFFQSFHAVEPTKKNIVVGVDVSGSMSATVNNTHLSAAEAAFIMALIHKRTEPNVEIIPFDKQPRAARVPERGSLEEYLKVAKSFNGGGTDCSAPIRALLTQTGYVADAFVIYTDSQTWAGQSHPCQAFAKYKKARNPNAKAIGVEMASTATTIADPSEPGMLSIVGMDASVPKVVRDFIRPEVTPEIPNQ